MQEEEEKERRILFTVIINEDKLRQIEGKNFDKERKRRNVDYGITNTYRCRVPSQRDYSSFSLSDVRITTLDTNIVRYFESSSSKPRKICPAQFKWQDMSNQQRLEWHLSEMSEGKKFNYQFINQ